MHSFKDTMPQRTFVARVNFNLLAVMHDCTCMARDIHPKGANAKSHSCTLLLIIMQVSHELQATRANSCR